MEKYWVQPHSEAQVRWVSAFRTYLLVSRDNFLVYSFWRVYKWWKWLCSIAWKGVVLPLLLESYAVVLKKQCNDNNCGSNRPYNRSQFQIVVVGTTIQHSWYSHVLSEIFETQNNDFSGRGASQNMYKHVLNFYDDNGKRFICPNRARRSNYVARPRFVCFVHRKISEKCDSRRISGNKGPMTTLERLAIDSRGWIHSLIWVLASNEGFDCIVYC